MVAKEYFESSNLKCSDLIQVRIITRDIMGNVFDTQAPGGGKGTIRMMDEKHLVTWRILFVEFAFHLNCRWNLKND